MARNLSRLFSPSLLRPQPNPGFPIEKLTPGDLSAIASSTAASRLLCSSTHPQREPSSPSPDPSQEKDEDLLNRDHEGDGSDEGDGEGGGGGEHVNEKTGEIGGPRGPEPTRFGDWERNGRCSDF